LWSLGLSQTHLFGLLLLDPEGSRSQSLGAIRYLSRGTGLQWLRYLIMRHKGPVQKPACIGTGTARNYLLFYSILFNSILFYSAQFYSILFCSIIFYSILFNSIRFYSVQFYSILFNSIQFYSILFYSILFYSILFN
jgi:hypothetical protein